MRLIHLPAPLLSLALLAWSGTPAAAQTQDTVQARDTARTQHTVAAPADTASAPSLARPAPAARTNAPRARRPSPAPASASVRQAASKALSRRVVISIADRRLWWLDGRDTLYAAPIAVGTGKMLQYGSKTWNFATPRGIRTVIGKGTSPVWIPPEWHYVELARDSAFTLVHLQRGRSSRLTDGSQLRVQGDRIVHLRADGTREVIPEDEEVIFGDSLFMPPVGTVNRQIKGELGAYKLDLGDGYLIHGTPHKTTIGTAASHGCIRVGDKDLEHLYKNVPVGVPVYIY